MNLAFMAKLGWSLVSEKQNLWARVVAGKYIRGEAGFHKLLHKPTSSNIWKGKASASSILNKGVRKTTTEEMPFSRGTSGQEALHY